MSEESVHIDEQILAEFETAWLSGKRLSIEELISTVTADDRLGTLIELVLVDMEFCWKQWNTGQAKPDFIESYTGRFAELDEETTLKKLVAEEYMIRQQFGDQAGRVEYRNRFPDLYSAIEFVDVKVQPARIPESQVIEPGTIIDQYEIVSLIGEGGMGSVFVAEQSHPVKRKVALKIIRKDLNSREIIARFDAERQALAMMEHAGIARILDGGATETGQPYFVMELVHGIAITEYCDQRQLSLRDRLGLFVAVCSAVQHAHQKGIVHRDLKPSNILISEYDGQPAPKVIDFGLAKALDSQQLRTDHSLATQVGQIVGTFKYMSPEQAEAGKVDIDTRTDVYALGVILYELLTGTTPLDKASLHNRAILKILEQIRDFEPPKPSAKLNSLQDSVSTIAIKRDTDPNRLSQILRGDLDWVVMKAIEKEIARRYESASSFAEDVQRFLDSEPVVARPPSTFYLFQKYVRKNRGLVSSAVAITTFLLAAIAGTSWFAYQADKSARAEITQRNIADAKSKEAAEQAAVANQARIEAEKSAKRSIEVLRIVTESFKSADPNLGANIDMPAVDVLFNAKNAMQSSELDDLGKAELLKTIGASFFGLGEYKVSAEVAEREIDVRTGSLGLDHLDTLESLRRLATSNWSAGKRKEAIQNYHKLLDKSKTLLGTEHTDTLFVMHNLASILVQSGMPNDSIRLFKETIELKNKTLGEEHQDTAHSVLGLAEAYKQVGKWEQALPLFETANNTMAKVYGPTHPYTLRALGGLASAYKETGRKDDAIKIQRRVLDVKKDSLGEKHPDTLLSMNSLAAAYLAAGKNEEAVPLMEDAYQGLAESLGEEHPQTLSVLNNLASTYWRQKQLDKSVPLFEKAMRLLEKKLGRKHPNTQMAVANLGINLLDSKETKRAIPLLEEAVESSKKFPHLSWVRRELKTAYFRDQNNQKFVEQLQLDEEFNRKHNPEGTQRHSEHLVSIGWDYFRVKRFAKAEQLINRGLGIQREIAAEDWNTFNTQSCLGDVQLAQEKFVEAKQNLEIGFNGLQSRLNEVPENMRKSLQQNAIKRLIKLAAQTENDSDLEKWKLELEKAEK